MNKVKIIILSLSLLLPVVIFLFLKSFGKNEFEVKALFQDSVLVEETCSGYKYDFPYLIPDSIASDFITSGDSIILIVFDDSVSGNRKDVLVQVERLHKESPLKRVWFVSEMNLDRRASSIIRNCIFLLKPTDQTVLIDSKRRIMGQYNLLDLDEADRLIMEVKIILKKY